MGLTATIEESLTKAITQATSFSEAQVWLSLHSANPGGTGASEITNGTGAQARQQLTFSGAGGVDTNTAQVSITVASGQTVRWFGYWTAQTGGTFLGGFPLVGPQQVATGISGSPIIAVPSHGRSVNDAVRLEVIPGTNSTVPTGFTADTVYYVVSVPDSDHVTLSATMGGSAITPSSSGGMVMCLDGTQPFSSGGVLVFPASTGITYETVS